MMSLVATPIVAARVAAPKKVRTQTVAKASSADQAKSSAVAGALALTMLAQPALAMNELGQIADKQSDAKALAAAEFAELQVKKKAPVKKAGKAAPAKSQGLFSSGTATAKAPKTKRAVSTTRQSQTYIDVTGKAYEEASLFTPQYDEVGVLPPLGRWDPLQIREQVCKRNAAAA